MFCDDHFSFKVKRSANLRVWWQSRRKCTPSPSLRTPASRKSRPPRSVINQFCYGLQCSCLLVCHSSLLSFCCLSALCPFSLFRMPICLLFVSHSLSFLSLCWLFVSYPFSFLLVLRLFLSYLLLVTCAGRQVLSDHHSAGCPSSRGPYQMMFARTCPCLLFVIHCGFSSFPSFILLLVCLQAAMFYPITIPCTRLCVPHRSPYQIMFATTESGSILALPLT